MEVVESGRVEINGRRHYINPLLGGRPSPSVSTIIWRTASENLQDWAVRQAVKFVQKNEGAKITKGVMLDLALKAPGAERNRAADIGTTVHNLLWEDRERWYLEEEKEIVTALSSWGYFLEQSGARRISDEVELVGLVDEDDTLGYGGTYDAIIEMPDGMRVLIDAKTSRQIHPPAALQLAAYWHLLEKQEEQIDEAWIVHLNKYYTDFSIKEVNRERAWRAFHAAHTLYGSLNENLWE